MPTSSRLRRLGDTRIGRLLRRRAAGTAALTLVLAGLLALFNWRGAIMIRDGVGVERVVPLVTIWENFFARLPQRGPGVLGRDPLLVGLVLAALALAYVLVATIRLPE